MLKTLILFGAAVTIAAAGEAYFWHMTDVHVQTTYMVGGDATQKCRVAGGDAGRFGNYKCDLPMETVESAAEFIVKKSAELGIAPQFLLYTGDIMSSRETDNSEANLRAHMENITTILHRIQDGIGNGMKVYPCIGNHDSAPKQHQFPDSPDWFSYTMSFELWKDFLDAEQQTSYKKGGFYTVQLQEKLRLVVMNTAMYFIENKNMTVDKNLDPLGQLAWLKGIFGEARANGEKLIIGTHIYSGLNAAAGNSMWDEWSDKILEVLDGNHDLIVAHFFGHDHRDSFRFFRALDGSDYSIGIMSSSLSANPGINPSVALVKYSTEAPFTILDRWVFYFDLEKANAEGKITWQQLYQYTTEYNIPDLSASSFQKLADSLADFNGEMWPKFYKNVYIAAPDHTSDATIHKKHLCSLLYTYSTDVDACLAAI